MGVAIIEDDVFNNHCEVLLGAGSLEASNGKGSKNLGPGSEGEVGEGLGIGGLGDRCGRDTECDDSACDSIEGGLATFEGALS